MPRMKMVLGETSFVPQMIRKTSLQNPSLPMSKTGNILSLRHSMLERVSSSRPSCGSCGKR